MEVVSLFPTAVGRSQLSRRLTSAEISILESFDTRPNAGNLASINQHVLETPELSELKKFILQEVTDYFDNVISPRNNITPYITISWTNVTTTNGFHHKHAHGNSILSGVFYVTADSYTDSIIFYDRVYETIEMRPKNWNIWNSDSWEIPVNTGDLLLFPSRLIHEVRIVNIQNHKRISLAFNVFIRGVVGDPMDSNLVEIK